MSANPTRVESVPTADPGSLPEGNRVFESIARQEALRALVAFSELHEQIRRRRSANGAASDRDLFETERFILDEVLQLICARAQAITQADAVVIALAKAPAANQSKSEESTVTKKMPEMVCRAAAGSLAVERGVPLIGESEFLQQCLESGRVLRCDDGETDARVELDFAHALGARSTVLVPLRGRREQLGVLQAFSKLPWAFTDHDVRSFSLFAELVLSALKPEDEDRRTHWLSDVAGDVLQAKPSAATTVSVDARPPEKTVVETGLVPSAEPATLQAPRTIPEPQIEALERRVTDPALLIELSETGVTDDLEIPLEGEEGSPPFPIPDVPAFLYNRAGGGNSRPGLNVVLGLVAVAALFSAGTWWGMRVHGTTAVTKASNKMESTPPSVTAPPAPAAEELSLAVGDNLMSPQKFSSEGAPLSAVAEGKLSALPKITGVRHWSSSVGSTVVIDMEDQVPYEVHRLMSPERIYFDLHDTVLAAELNGKTMDIGDASLARVRVAQPVAGVTRVVLDTKDGSNFAVSMEANPYRLVVELRGSEKSLTASRFAPKGTLAKLPTASALPTTVPAKEAPVAGLTARASDQPLSARTFPSKSGKFRIVLDAGHGGWDLGTVGRQGLLEKDLVLDVTQRLGRLLQTRLGSEVMFTRTGDTYLPLDQRADIANQSQADLFVSVHANYSSSAAARGVETYYTNLFSDPGSREVEKHDDGTFTKPTPVSLTVDALHDKIEESRRLASSVQRSLYATLASNSPDIRNRGIKDSAFVVLTGTTMPSILTEISFVSSPADEKNLQSAAYRQQIAEALYQGIARYQQASPRVKVAQLQTATARR